ncbi:MAG: hypothetical protein RI956_790 [Pseudomonadota bacterium]|jgi:uncharacterized membrane protein YedE/YeeE
MTILSNILQPLLGGVFIGCASWLLLSSVGRIAGVSGIVSGLFFSESSERAWRIAFLMGLIVGGYATASWFTSPVMPPRAVSLLLVAGLLVGFGTVWGSGCTSGHGVCGLGRRSVRSLVATLTFMTTGFLTVFIVNLIN